VGLDDRALTRCFTDLLTRRPAGIIPAFPRKSKEVAMKKSLLTSGNADRFLRAGKLVLSAILVLCAFAAPGQFGGGATGQPQNSFAGTWRGTYQNITFTIVIQPNGQYTQTAQSGSLMTEQSGPYTLAAPNTIIFSVTNWAPKAQKIYHPTGTTGGYYTDQVVAKPPGATDSYVFRNANTLVLTDQMTHGSITLTRVR
jgi:hypothetical protein